MYPHSPEIHSFKEGNGIDKSGNPKMGSVKNRVQKKSQDKESKKGAKIRSLPLCPYPSEEGPCRVPCLENFARTLLFFRIRRLVC